MSLDNGLDAVEPWLAGILARLSPGERMKITRKIGQLLRRRNAERIRANVQPDGSPMEPRKPRRDKRGRVRGRKGKMFPKIGLARNMRVTARPDEVEVSFSPLVSGAAKVHHWGLVDRVEKEADGPSVRFPARHLLGINSDDREEIMAEVMKWLNR